MKKLLLIDDELLILTSMKVLLEDTAEEIYTAENGREGLAILKAHQIDCVVSDINMPVMNGVELLRHVREFNKTLPFIFYTGHGNRELMMEAAKLGAFDFLDKPFLDGLEDVVLRALGTGKVANSESFLSEYSKLIKDSKGK